MWGILLHNVIFDMFLSYSVNLLPWKQGSRWSTGVSFTLLHQEGWFLMEPNHQEPNRQTIRNCSRLFVLQQQTKEWDPVDPRSVSGPGSRTLMTDTDPISGSAGPGQRHELPGGDLPPCWGAGEAGPQQEGSSPVTVRKAAGSPSRPVRSGPGSVSVFRLLLALWPALRPGFRAPPGGVDAHCSSHKEWFLSSRLISGLQNLSLFSS